MDVLVSKVMQAVSDARMWYSTADLLSAALRTRGLTLP